MRYTQCSCCENRPMIVRLAASISGFQHGPLNQRPAYAVSLVSDKKESRPNPQSWTVAPCLTRGVVGPVVVAALHQYKDFEGAQQEPDSSKGELPDHRVEAFP